MEHDECVQGGAGNRGNMEGRCFKDETVWGACRLEMAPSLSQLATMRLALSGMWRAVTRISIHTTSNLIH